MKNLYLTLFIFFFFGSSNLFSQAFAITTWSQGVCVNTSAYAAVTSTQAGAGSYSWTVLAPGACGAQVNPGANGLSAMITYSCCGINTVICTAYASGNPTLVVGSPVMVTVLVSCSVATNPVISNSAPNASLCSGGNAVLTGSGVLTYTWVPGNVNFASIVVSPTANTCYTLLGTNANGCMGMATSCMSVLPTYTISVSGSTQVCLGTSTTFTLSGGPSFLTQPGNITSANPVLTPTVNTSYTLTCPAVAYACATSTVVNVAVLVPQSIGISGSSTACAGTSQTLSALGGLVSYTWNTGATGNSIVVTPNANICYSLAGTSANSCTNLASLCVTILPSPSLSISGNASVCLGSSLNFTASGANSYTWNTSPAVYTNTLSLISSGSFTYMAYGTGTNGCVGFVSYPAMVNNNCAIVWPGDANRDGAVSNTDVLELGLAAGSTGPARTPTSNAWNGQYANAWSGTVSTGWNKVNADCNGDGVINAGDNTAISLNFSLTHGFREQSIESSNPDLYLASTGTIAYSGNWNKVDVMAGDATNSFSQLYGLAFDLNYDQNLLQTDSVKLLYPPSFLNNSNQNIDFGKSQFANGKLYAATVRTDHINVSGNGKIAEFWFKVKPAVPANSILQLSVSNAVRLSASAISNTMSTQSQTLMISTAVSGLNAQSFNDSFGFYPNPASTALTLLSGSALPVQFVFSDLLGREIFKAEFSSSTVLDISFLPPGTYFMRFESGGSCMHKKLVVER
ncbi:MAG TPA: T9SS type A sorting domain-containing protein [Bacteroidia bacterium]|nr:T9SS type A sorting domain-containing protein [Bacteroidia bacterium]